MTPRKHQNQPPYMHSTEIYVLILLCDMLQFFIGWFSLTHILDVLVWLFGIYIPFVLLNDVKQLAESIEIALDSTCPSVSVAIFFFNEQKFLCVLSNM